MATSCTLSRGRGPVSAKRFWGIFSGEVTLSNKKVSTTVYITQDQSQQLKELHARTKVPVAEYIRQGIDKVLEENADKLPGQLSLMQ
jgi:hypothetical protein